MIFKKKKANADFARYQSVRYRPVSRRRRLLIGLLALATAALVLLYILDRRDAIHRHPLLLKLPADVSACQGGKTTGCVGGMATVIITPLRPAAPASGFAPAASAPPAPPRPAPG